MARKPHTYSPAAVEAAVLLGLNVAAARRERRMSVEELAERVGVNHQTIRKVERGDLTVGLGPAFEAAAVLGVPLFSEDPQRRLLERGRLEDRLTALPQRARRPEVTNDF